MPGYHGSRSRTSPVPVSSLALPVVASGAILLSALMSMSGCTRAESTAGSPRFGTPSMLDNPDPRFLSVETPLYHSLDPR